MPPARIDRASSPRAAPAITPATKVPSRLTTRIPSGKGCDRMVGEDRVEREAGDRREAAEQADRDPGRGAHAPSCRRCCSGGRARTADGAADEGRRRVGEREAGWPRVDHVEELELEGREGGQGPAEAGGEEGEARALGAVAAHRADEEPEQEGAGEVDREGRPGPGGAPCGSASASPTRARAPTTPPT